MTDSKKHFVIDIDYLNDIALSIAENVPEEYYVKFVNELYQYLKCAISEEEYQVEVDENGFYTLSECDVKDCNSVGKENNNLTDDKE